MGFLSGLVGAAVKTVTSPIVIVSDIVTGESNSIDLAENIVDDVMDSFEDLVDGDII